MPDDAVYAAVLFADVVGSMELYKQLGDARARAEIRRFLSDLEGQVHHYGGRVIKLIGDEMMCAFASADAACDAACAFQRCTEQAAETYGVPFALRIGFHGGHVIEDSGDLFGDTVNVAARVASMATQDRILTTEETFAALSGERQGLGVSRGFATVKGIEEGLPLREVIWREERTIVATADKLRILADVVPNSRLRLRCGGQELILEIGRQPISIGRSSGNALVIADPCVSGSHARIERRGGQFVLRESSSNGTYVAFEGEAYFRAPRTLTLRRSGRMAFGRAPDDSKAVIAEFLCE